MTAKLAELGFKTCPYDPGLFIHSRRPHLYLTSHVDDCKIVAEHPEDAQWVIDQLAMHFELKDMGQISHYLGTDVEFKEEGILVHQEKYARELVSSFGLENAHPVKTSLDSGFIVDDEPDLTLNVKEYQRGTGSLQYLTSKTRPDIAYSVNLLSRFNSRPTRKCWTGLIHLLKYIKGTTQLGIFYRYHGDCWPTGYSDSDWAGLNTEGRKSVGGYIFSMAGAPISWNSKKQTCTAASFNEVEYIAASEAAREAWWIREIIRSLAISNLSIRPIQISMDNRGAIDLTSSLGTPRSKHIDVRYHITRDYLALGQISMNQVSSQEMAADGLTKVLNIDRFRKLFAMA